MVGHIIFFKNFVKLIVLLLIFILTKNSTSSDSTDRNRLCPRHQCVRLIPFLWTVWVRGNLSASSFNCLSHSLYVYTASQQDHTETLIAGNRGATQFCVTPTPTKIFYRRIMSMTHCKETLATSYLNSCDNFYVFIIDTFGYFSKWDRSVPTIILQLWRTKGYFRSIQTK